MSRSFPNRICQRLKLFFIAFSCDIDSYRIMKLIDKREKKKKNLTFSSSLPFDKIIFLRKKKKKKNKKKKKKNSFLFFSLHSTNLLLDLVSKKQHSPRIVYPSAPYTQYRWRLMQRFLRHDK